MLPLPDQMSQGPAVAFTPNTRYPDPAVEILHDSFVSGQRIPRG